MRHLFFKTMAITLSLSALSVVPAMAQTNSKPFVIPELKEWTGKTGDFPITPQTRIVYPESDTEMQRIAEIFSSDFAVMSGIGLEVSGDKPAAGDIIFSIRKDKELGTEGYSIAISDKVKVTAQDYKGIYWATRTLLQMSEQTGFSTLPKGTVRDFPDYAVRGFMMDCGRKYIPLAYLEKLVKIMSYYKMNTLQVHLNDNGFKQFFQDDWDRTYAAFRLECDTFPGLTARDGSYTKDEFRDFQKQSSDMYVEIIPEIDAPAHTLAFSHYDPELGSKEYGMDHLDLFNPKTYEFMDALFKEYLEGDDPVFVGPKVHIGTDEYSNKDQAVVEKFREFTDRYIKYVEGFGKQACVWGALTHAKGETPVKSENVIMSAWYNGYADPKDMVSQGYKLISIPDGLVYMVPAAGYYYDYLNTGYLYDNWTPAHVGDVVFEEKDPAILGGMFAVWNDHVGNGISVKDIHHRLFPALQTLSGKMWTGASVTVPYSEFDTRRLSLSEAPGVNELGRAGEPGSLVYSVSSLVPGTEVPFREIGYDYTVSFDITGAEEKPGTELFRSESAVFYLADPVKGQFGYARDGYLYSLDFRPYPGEKVHIEIQGDSKSTVLKVNGRVFTDNNTYKIWCKEGEAPLSQVRTLVFPLGTVGDFNSKITNFEIYNFKK